MGTRPLAGLTRFGAAPAPDDRIIPGLRQRAEKQQQLRLEPLEHVEHREQALQLRGRDAAGKERLARELGLVALLDPVARHVRHVESAVQEALRRHAGLELRPDAREVVAGSPELLQHAGEERRAERPRHLPGERGNRVPDRAFFHEGSIRASGAAGAADTAVRCAPGRGGPGAG